MQAETIEKTAASALLCTTQKNNYARDGFLVIQDFVPTMLCDLLMDRAKTLIHEFDPGVVKTIFSSKDQKHSRNQYFLNSDNTIRFFFEENAFDEKGELRFEKELCINKFGHAMHAQDPVFYSFSHQQRIAALVQELGLHDPLCVQSMYICKQPRIGGEVLCHQDATYLYTKKQPVIGLWFALQDATKENGCLWAIPGGHQGKLKSRFIRENDQTRTEVYDDTPWSLEKMIPLEVPRGSVIVLHGRSPHMSYENVSERSRHAYTLHFIASDAEFAEDNWMKSLAATKFY